jgi:Flp pilus assembly protein TadB
MEKDDYQKLLERYKGKIREEFGEKAVQPRQISSREYTEFKRELYPTSFSFYEKACNFSENLLKIKEDPKRAIEVQKELDICLLNITPSGALSFSILAGVIALVFGSLFSYALPLLLGLEPMLILILFSVLGGLLLILALRNVPFFLANTWRMKASNQMIQSIFYMVTYMRHTSNLERAIEFAADHLEPPLSLDFRKILWDVETERYSSIKESANAYLEKWKDWNKEFVESFHLLESSLYESSEERRLTLLDKSLDVILEGTYENMLHYAHNLKSPITMLHMLGIVLPILGLVILPLVVSFLAGESNPLEVALIIAALYNVALPIAVYYLGRNILSKRPAGYGAPDISEKESLKDLRNVNFSPVKNFTLSINPFFFCLTFLIIAIIVGLSPLIIHSLNPDFELQDKEGTFQLMGYVCPSTTPNCTSDEKLGPFGIGASLLSLVIVAGIGVSIGLYFSLRSQNIIKIREKTKALEDEFSTALFQLGNRLGDGLPAEIAFSKVAKTMENTTSGEFFNLASKNISKLGMGLEESIFHPKVGALASFPSNVIESSMKVLSESIRKGPRIAAQALLSMSRYIKEIGRVEERLKDLMGDVISSMRSQVKFLTPAIAGIVIGITSMISEILTKLSAQLGATASSGSGAAAGGMGNMLSLIGIGLPPYFFQIIVGLYVVQISYILTVLSNGIENGADKLGERFAVGQNLISSTLLYCFIAGVVMVLFHIFASAFLGKTMGF